MITFIHYDEAVNTSPSLVQFVPEGCKTHKICNKDVNRCFFVSDSIPDWYKTQQMRDRVVSVDRFLIVYCPEKYKPQWMRDEAVEDCLAALTFISDWFVTSKILEKFVNAFNANDILFDSED